MQKRKEHRLNTKTARLLDANLNRAREGLRVVEDTARYIWEKPKLYKKIRQLRHKLHKATAIRYKDLIESRDSQLDSGRKVKEGGRASLDAVVSANIRRAQEATRVLEEFSKIFSKTSGRDFKEIRYQLYDIEKDLIKNGRN